MLHVSCFMFHDVWRPFAFHYSSTSALKQPFHFGRQLKRASQEALAVNGYLERKEAGEWANPTTLNKALR